MAAKDDILDLALPAQLLELGDMLSQRGSPRQTVVRQEAVAGSQEQICSMADALLEKVVKDPTACRFLGLRKGMCKASILIRIKSMAVLSWKTLRMSSDPVDIGDLSATVSDPKQVPNESLLRTRHEIGLMLAADVVMGNAEGDGPIRRVRLPSRTLEWLSGGKASMGSVTVAKLVGLGTPAESFLDNKRKPEAPKKLTPKQLFDGIRSRVIGLDEQAKILAGRLCLHMTRAELLRAGRDPGTPNECFLILGSPGTGKTHLCSVAGELCGSVFAVADGSDLSAEAYVGLSASDTLRFLLMAAGGDVEKARYGFLAIDEVTKKARSLGESPVNTTAVQQELLRIISGQTMIVGGRRGWDRPMSFNTVGTCFALMGHCPGLDHIIEKKMGPHAMGFSPNHGKKRSQAWFADALLEFGIIEEIISRLSAILVTPLPALSTLVKAVNTEHGIVASYNRLLEGHGAMMFLGDAAVIALSEYGMESGGYFRAMKRAISTLAGEIVFSEQKGTVMIEAADIHRAAAKSDGCAEDLLRHGGKTGERG